MHRKAGFLTVEPEWFSAPFFRPSNRIASVRASKSTAGPFFTDRHRVRSGLPRQAPPFWIAPDSPCGPSIRSKNKPGAARFSCSLSYCRLSHFHETASRRGNSAVISIGYRRGCARGVAALPHPTACSGLPRRQGSRRRRLPCCRLRRHSRCRHCLRFRSGYRLLLPRRRWDSRHRRRRHHLTSYRPVCRRRPLLFLLVYQLPPRFRQFRPLYR